MPETTLECPLIVAEMWWCMDDDCDCWQPQIDLVVRRTGCDFEVYDYYRIWEGECISGPSHDEYAAMKDALRAKMAELEIAAEHPVLRGSRAATTEEIAEYMLEERKSMGPRGDFGDPPDV